MTDEKAGDALWAFAAVMFLVYPVLRMYSTEVGIGGADALWGTEWSFTLVCATLGFIAVAFALQMMKGIISETCGASVATAAVIAIWIGVGLTLAYYVTEVIVLNAMGTQEVSESSLTLADLAEPTRSDAQQLAQSMGIGFILVLASATAGIGLFLLLTGGICTSVAVRRSGILPAWTGLPPVMGFVLFLAQFFGSFEVRIAHGVLMFLGCIVMAWA